MSEAFEAVFGQPSATEVTSEPPAETVSEGRQRDEHGRFASAASSEPAPAETPPAATPEPSATPPVEPGHVPLSVVLDEREKRQAAQAERDALAKRIAELEAARTPTEPEAPEERTQAELHRLRDQTQRLSVEVEHGKASVAEAYKWAFERCETDKDFNAQMAARIGLVGNPYQVAVEAHRQHAELEEFNAWKATRNAPAPATADPTPTPQSTAPTPPRSLANAPGNGGAGVAHVPVHPGAAFGSLFNR